MSLDDDPYISSLGLYVLDDEDNPVLAHNVLSWGEWMETHPHHLAQTLFPWGRVSTIFLGIDASMIEVLIGVGPLTHKPTLWETMVFGGPLNLSQWQYNSKKDALEGHRQAVVECKKAQVRLIGHPENN
jgi:hypothetical protein